ncbi:hypothetical protein Adt_01037 [Abeliophyllum distichum]|uniref:Uncharacterized protein n=1 Tax=Abeliophyllum distichum TaxID=126358 RepID=A0ABD1VRQ8_9LAMI
MVRFKAIVRARFGESWIWASMERFCSRREWGERELGRSNRNGGRIYTGMMVGVVVAGLGHEERAQRFGDEWDVKRGQCFPFLFWVKHIADVAGPLMWHPATSAMGRQYPTPNG